MRSEKDQLSGGRERRIVEIQLRDQVGVSANPKPKEEKKEIFTKVVIRRLPPNLSKDQLEEQISPLPAYDYFEIFSADQSLYPYLFSRAYINFRNPEDIVLFRDRFDGYVFIDSKGQEYPAVVEFAPFQKVSKKTLKKTDAKAGSIEQDPEYGRFLESYCCEEEKVTANPETLLGEIEAKAKELIARRTTPLLEYIKIKKLEKQRMREEKREERRRREQEKKRQREEEKRRRREEERQKHKETEKQKKLVEIKIKLLKKSGRDEDLDSDRQKDSGETDRNKCDKSSEHAKRKDLDKETKDKLRLREKDSERHPGHEVEHKHQRHRHEFTRFMPHTEETKWGKGVCKDRAKKDSHHHSYSHCQDMGDELGKDDREVMGSQKERLRNKDQPAMQLYQPGAHSCTHTTSGGQGYDSFSNSPEHGAEPRYEVAMGTGSEKSGDE
ncbi:hypothetical protein JZ751_029290 [Albula glossodonta]|uniref:UPF3 domain-containing protein n=1 Tax=Albula glossodonta TaxID=121402 RepID=A0A8T2P633_9TELE|nr:hypothetical protein JZ751_029290 [Albula glossodonta]